MLLTQRRFTHADEDRLHLNIASVKAMMVKYHLTELDLLTGLRYSTAKHKWDENVERATETCRAYDSYHDVDPVETERVYGED